MKVIGLTGGIGMGKSTAAAEFRRAGIPVFDADAAVRRLQGPDGRALSAIKRAFPGTVTDGRLDRAALRGIVLADGAKRRRLEALIHPLVQAEQQRFLARARASGKSLAVLDIPLLLEGSAKPGRRHALHKILVVSAPLEVQIRRVLSRPGLTRADAESLIALQMPDAEKRRRADVVIRTGLSRFHATAAIRRFIVRERAKARGRA